MLQPTDNNASRTETEDEVTGLPLLPTWRRVYWFVTAVFTLYVALLLILSKVFL